MRLSRIEIATPVGRLVVIATAEGLCSVDFADRPARTRAVLRRRFGDDVRFADGRDPHGARAAFTAYFGGDTDALSGLPLDVEGTAFERRVWRALRRIRPGEVMSYGRLAAMAGTPGGARAVGNANGRNPVAIVVPCHRVVRGNGEIGGYGGGPARKRKLLAHENAAIRPPAPRRTVDA